jgi:DNA-binding transcriptional LysR family regulator
VVAYPQAPGIVVIPYRQDRLVLACPPGHRLASLRRVAVKKLAGEPLVGFERDIPTRKETDRILRRYGVEAHYVMELDNIETIKRVVEIGRGLAILPEPALGREVESGTLVAVHLADQMFLRPLGIIHRQGKPLARCREVHRTRAE